MRWSRRRRRLGQGAARWRGLLERECRATAGRQADRADGRRQTAADRRQQTQRDTEKNTEPQQLRSRGLWDGLRV
jgi:hypothetical protein